MMFRAVVRGLVSVAMAAVFSCVATAQDTNPVQTPKAAQNAGQSSTQGASTIGSSTSLDSNSNELTSLYGTPAVEIIARVNDQVITNDDLSRAQSELAQEARQNNWNFEQTDQAQKNLLRDLVDQQLLLSKGKQLGITGDTELVKRLDDIRKQNHLSSMDDLEKAVEQQGTSYEDFKANIRNSIITQRVVRQEVGSKLQISQADIQQYYKDHLDSFTQPESIHLEEILIPTPQNSTDSELNAANAKAKEVEAKLKAGATFADMAKQYSGGPTAQEGGDLGDFKRGALAKVLEDQTFNLPVGGYTEPIRTRQGYIILKVTAHNPGGTPPLEKVEPQIEEALYMQKIDPAVRQYLTRLRTEAYIDIRPGYTDSAASPDETKPTFTAYVPPQPKKKKKKARFIRHVATHGRYSERGKQVAAPAVAVNSGSGAATAAPSSSATAANASTAAGTASAQVKPVEEQKHKVHKPKREKIRYGQAPAESVSEQQMTSANGSSSAPATTTPANPALAADVQPLGPDLEHNPTINKPKQQKTRFSDEARSEHKAKTHAKKVEAKKVRQDSAKPTPLTANEAANQKVESAPLGLAGDTTHKAKKPKVKAKNGEKTRYSDEKTKKKEDENSGTGSQSPSPASDSQTSAPSSGSGSTGQQP